MRCHTSRFALATAGLLIVGACYQAPQAMAAPGDEMVVAQGPEGGRGSGRGGEGRGPGAGAGGGGGGGGGSVVPGGRGAGSGSPSAGKNPGGGDAPTVRGPRGDGPRSDSVRGDGPRADRTTRGGDRDASTPQVRKAAPSPTIRDGDRVSKEQNTRRGRIGDTKRGPNVTLRDGRRGSAPPWRSGRRLNWGGGTSFYFYDGHYYGDCAWVLRRAQATGSRYWWTRYRQCRNAY